MFLLSTLAEIDYTSLVMEEVVFQPSTSVMCVNISTLSDNTLESNETFVVLLATSDPDVNLGANSTTITIQNDDGKWLDLMYQ